MSRTQRVTAGLVALALAGAFVATAPPAGAAPPVPAVALAAPATPMLGENVTFSATFDNTDTTAVGYGPYVDLFVPTTGTDGAGSATDDGLTFAGATYLGTPVTTTAQTITSCPVTHPILGTTVACPAGIRAGDQLVVAELPFGSFAPAQPPAALSVTLTMSNLADAGTPMTIAARPFFRYGSNPLDDPLGDPPIVGSTTATTVTPTVVQLTKQYVGPEDETATGPNFPRQYRLVADVATGQSVTNLTLGDRMATNVQYLGVASPAENPGTIDYVTEPALGAPQLPPGNRLGVRFATVTGGAGANDAVVVFDYFVPRDDANGNPVLDPATGDDATAPDDATLSATWTPTDGRDGPVPITIDAAGPEHTLTPKAIAIQSSVAPTTVLPGSVVTYTLPFQISDWFSFDDLVLTDILGDGLTVDPNSFTVSATDRTGTTSGAINPSFVSTSVDNACAAGADAGRTAIALDVSGALGDLGGTGRLLGGLVLGAGSGATTGTITFQATVQEDYRCDKGSGDLSIDQRDRVTNAVTIDGRILADPTLLPTGSREADTSAVTATIQDATFTKTIYARNGSTVGPFTEFAPGDTITYRLRYDMPGSDLEDLVLTDYLPLPVLRVGELSGPQFTGAPSAIPPPAGQMAYGPAETFTLAPNNGPAPTVDTSSAAAVQSNYFTLTYGTFDGNNTIPATIDILFTVTVGNDPFADGLFLTNQARATSDNSFLEARSDDQIVQFDLTEPALRLTKGVVATDHAGATFSPTTPGPVAFSAPPGALGPPRWTGTIGSTNLTALPINSNITSGVDGGDLVSFAVVIENQGSGLHGAFDTRVRDTVPAGFTVPAAATLNLQVTDGAGNALASTNVGGGSGLFDQGIELTDGAGVGALGPYDASSGANIAVITYNLRLDDAAAANPVAARTLLTNTATLTNYSSTEGGPDYTVTDLTDTASVRVSGVGVTKSISATSAPSTVTPAVAIGEIVDYTVTLTVPEGVTPSFTVTDTLDAGLAFVSFTSATASPALTTTAGGGSWSAAGTAPAVTPANAGATGDGRVATWNFATVTNSDTDNTVPETITLVYRVVVLNVAGNQNSGPTQLNNSVAAPGGTGAASNVRVAEPLLQVTKSVAPAAADAGDTVTFTVVVNHDVVAPGVSNATAFDVTLTDDVGALLPNGFQYVPNSFVNTAGTAPTTLNGATSPISASWSSLPVGASSTLTFQATIPDAIDVVAVNGSMSNTVNLDWSSLPGNVTVAQSAYNAFSVERTGDTTDPGTNVNDYRASASAAVAIANGSIAKALVATSEPATSGAALAIGEVGTYRLTVRLPEGDLSSFTVTDALPAGLQYVAGSATRDTTGFGGTLGAMTVNLDPPGGPPGSGDDVVITFGPTVVDTSAGGDESFTIDLQAVVLDTPANRGDNPYVAGNQATSLTDTAVLAIAGTTATSPPVTVTVVEPYLSITKTFSPATAAANDTTQVTVSVSNDGAAPAFDVVLDDPLDQAAFVPGSATAVTTPSGFTMAVLGSSPSGYDTVRYTADGSAGSAIDPGETVTFVFSVTLASNVPVPGSVINIATVTRATTLPGVVAGERDEPDVSDSAGLTFSAPDLAITKDDGIDLPALIQPGDTVTYTLTIANNGARDATGVVVSDPVPAGLSYVGSSGSGTLASGTVTWPAFALAAGASTTRTITFTVVDPLPNAMLSITNTASVTDDGTHGADPNPADNSASDTDYTASVIDLALTKTDGVTTTAPGATLTYTLTVTNQGNQDAVDAVLTDTIPANTTFLSASGGGLESGGVVTWPAFDLGGAAGGNNVTTRTVTVTVDATVPAGAATIDNAANVSAPGDVDSSNDDAVDTDTLAAAPDLAITKTDGVTTAVRGDSLTYTLTVTNGGDQDATGLVVADTLPTGTTFGAASASGTETAGVVSWPPFDLAAGAQATRTVTVTVDDPIAPGIVQLDNDATVQDDGTNGPDPTPADNTAHDIDTTGAALSVTKDDGTTRAVPGAPLRYTITVTNAGPESLDAVTVSDAVPPALTGAVFTPSEGSFDALTGAWTGLSLAAGDSITLTLDATVALDATGSVVNTVTVAPVGVTDPDPSDNTATDTDTVTPRVDLTLSKQAVGGFAPGGRGRYSFTVTNRGPSNADAVVVHDPLPRGLAFLAGDGTGWTCSAAGAAVTCEYGTTLAPGATTSFALAVRVAKDAPATVRNAAAVGVLGSADLRPGDNRDVASVRVVAPQPPRPPDPVPPPPGPGAMPYTGTDAGRAAVVGLLALVVGAVLMGTSRRGRRTPRRPRLARP